MNNNLKRLAALLVSGFLSMPLLAHTTRHHNDANTPWSITASMGLGTMPYMEGAHGQTPLGRLAFDYAFTQHLGLEMGIQNGNHMRFALPKETVMTFGGVPVEGTLKPALDILLSARTPYLNSDIPLYSVAKAGVMYRQLQMDRESMNDLIQNTAELQAGIAYQFNQHVDVQLMYQYVFGAYPDIQVDALTEIGHIAHIPAQSSVLLGIRVNLE
jgi:hypothetical protein